MSDSQRKAFLNRGEPNHFTPIFAKIALGDLLTALTGPPTVGTFDVGTDLSDEIAGRVRAVYASAGYAVGAKLIVPNDGRVTPGAGECQVSFDVATGKSIVAFASADAVTECVVEYDATSDAYAALIGDEF